MERGLYVALGLVVGVVAAVGFAAWRLADDPEPTAPSTNFPAVVHDTDAAEALVVAWEWWRTATFVSEGTWTRTVDDIEDPLSGSIYTAQDPPRRLVVRLGSTIEQLDDQVATCDSSNDDVIAPACVAGSGMTYAERVAVEMNLVESYVSGTTRLYDVATGSTGCYQLEPVLTRPASPWGLWAEFCFDDDSGVLRRATIRRQSATDVEVAVSVRTDVSDDDFG